MAFFISRDDLEKECNNILTTDTSFRKFYKDVDISESFYEELLDLDKKVVCKKRRNAKSDAAVEKASPSRLKIRVVGQDEIEHKFREGLQTESKFFP